MIKNIADDRLICCALCRNTSLPSVKRDVRNDRSTRIRPFLSVEEKPLTSSGRKAKRSQPNRDPPDSTNVGFVRAKSDAARQSSLWCGEEDFRGQGRVVQVSPSSSDHCSELRGPPEITLVWLPKQEVCTDPVSEICLKAEAAAEQFDAVFAKYKAMGACTEMSGVLVVWDKWRHPLVNEISCKLLKRDFSQFC
ncbi:hypothetical protein AVEN_112296-1 [Araneus ventricosus]|uniref:Uncharacterized protein n=1 Tax=Araneus ventricosus TaxID=182803 RepID=A0A4Y2N5A3_ARAVE|nr:hypothetical protein AVEN_112296-1 [Araneus ventricosus]